MKDKILESPKNQEAVIQGHWELLRRLFPEHVESGIREWPEGDARIPRAQKVVEDAEKRRERH